MSAMRRPSFEAAWRSFDPGHRLEGVAAELPSLIKAVYDQIHARPTDMVGLRESLDQLLSFLASPDGRTIANCAATDLFFCLSDDVDWSHLPDPYGDIMSDIAGALHDTVSAPEIARNFESTPEQLLDRLRSIRNHGESVYQAPEADTGLRSPQLGASTLGASIVSEKMAVAGVYGDLTQAHLARIRLEGGGIDAYVFDDGVVTANPLLAPALGGIRVVVRSCDLNEAEAILIHSPKISVEDQSCPHCQSTNITKTQSGLRFAFLTILFLGFPVGRSRSMITCHDCGHSWRE